MKLLYLSCHEVLEYDEVSLFRELGIDVFAAGAYLSPRHCTARLRPALPNWTVDENDLEAYQRIASPTGDARDALTLDFVDRFDAVMVMHLPRWIANNWDVLRHKVVIWRTIGQSIPRQEFLIKAYREDELRIVRYSPAERTLDEYAGEDAMIRFYKDPAEWGGWTGAIAQVMCVAQSLPERAVPCNYQAFLDGTAGLPRALFGPGNAAAGSLWQGCPNHEELQQELRRNRVCFSTGTFPASYTLGFIEAWMTGIPIVAIGRQLFGQAGPELASLYEVPQLIEHGRTGFVSDDMRELRDCVARLLSDWGFAREISAAGRAAASRVFSRSAARDAWRQFFKTHVGT